MSKTKGPGQYQQMARKARRKNNNQLLRRGANTYHPPSWKRVKKGTTVSAPPGALEEVEGSKENKDLILAVFGPSGSGKTHTRQIILSTLPHFEEIKSFSTRPKRELPGAKNNEIDNEYRFTSFDDFADRMRNKNLVNIVNYEDNWYGTDVDDVEIVKQGVLITDISSLHELYDTVTGLGKDIIFVYPEIPSLAELTRRHRERYDKNYLHHYDNPEEEFVKRRLKAEDEILEFYQQLPALKSDLPILSLDEFLNQTRTEDQKNEKF
jgi:guanylate kinase